MDAEADGRSKTCRVYAILRESNGARSATLCGGEARERTAYVTLANSVEIRVITGQSAKHVVSFMLRYQGESLEYIDQEERYMYKILLD